MKTLASFSKPQDAHLLVSRLEGSGVSAYVRDEHMVSLDWLASNAVGGVKVDVADEDFPRALEIMNEGVSPQIRRVPGRRHKRGRYVWLFLFSFAGLFLLVSAQTGPGGADYRLPLVAGAVLAAFVTGLAAALDL